MKYAAFAVLVLFLSNGAKAARNPSAQAGTADPPAAVDALLGATTEEQRSAWLDVNPSLLSSKLFDALAARGHDDVNKDVPKADKEYSAALAVAERLRDSRALGVAFAGLGLVRYRQGRLADALDYYQRGVPASEAAGDKSTLAVLLRGVGLSLQLTGQPQSAAAPFERSLAVSREIGDQLAIAGVLGNIGLLRGDLGDLRSRDAFLQESLRIAEANHFDAQARNTYNNLGAAHITQGDFEVGLGYLEKALALSTTLHSSDREFAMTFANMGVASLRLGRFDKAAEQYRESMARYQKIHDEFGIALVLNNLGELHRFAGDYASAKTELEEAVPMFDKIGHQEGRTEARQNLAWARLGLNDVAGGLATAQEAVSISREIKYQAALTKALDPLGDALLRLGRRDEARRAFQEAVELTETSRRTLLGGGNEGESFLQEYIGPYHALLAMALEDGRSQDALAMAEQARARQLFDSIHPGNVLITHAMTPAEREEEQRLTGDISRLDIALAGADPAHSAAQQTELDEAIRRLEAFRLTLYSAHPELRYQRADLPRLSNSDLTALLPDVDTALVEYAVTGRGVFAFVVTRDAAGQISLTAEKLSVTRASVERDVEAFRDQLATRDLNFSKAARNLYATVVGPLDGRLHGKTMVAIVPDGALWDLPFQALIAPSGRYFIEDHAVFYAPSLTTLSATKNLRHAGQGAPSLLAISAPPPNETPLPVAALPQSSEEVRKLRAVYGNAGSVALTGANALEDRWKAEAGKYRVLHFATHGVLNSTSPLYSYLVLGATKGSANDGLLEARQILDLDLHADIAVLSACETARGRFTYGEGLIGMSWAFLVAGTPTTVASQWKVDANAASRLMVAFHHDLVANGGATLRGRARALQQAAIAMTRSADHHPFYWAAFTMVGDGF